MKKEYKRIYTKIGKKEGYTKKEIDQSIKSLNWEKFRKNNLPFCQGECLKTVINDCNIPISKIINMSLHGVIKNTHGFYALNVNYKNGNVNIFIADCGVSACVVASDFLEY